MKTPGVTVLFITVCMAWGTTWMAMQVAVTSVPPIFATGLRFLFSAPLLLWLAKRTGAPLLLPPGRRGMHWAIGLFYFAIPFTLMIHGERSVSPGLAAIIFSTMPAGVLLAGRFLYGERATRRQIIGLVLALPALSAILWLEMRGGSGDLQGIGALLLAVAMHSVMYVVCKRRLPQIPVLTFNALPCLGAAVLLLIVGTYWEQPQPARFAARSVAAIAYLGLAAGVIGILAYFALQQRAGSFKASAAFLVFPLVALAIDACVAGRLPSAVSLWLLLPLTAGVALVLRPASDRTACVSERRAGVTGAPESPAPPS